MSTSSSPGQRKRAALAAVLLLPVFFLSALAGGLGAAAQPAPGSGSRGSGPASASLPEGRLDEVGAARAALAPEQSTVLFSEGFESAWPSGAWSVFDNDGAANGEYHWANRCTGSTGQRSAWAVGGGASGSQIASCGDPYPNHADSWMIYGPFDFRDVTAAALDFDFWLNSECVGTDCVDKSDRLQALASTDGVAFDGIYLAGDWYADPRAVNGWLASSYDMAAFAGEPEVWIAFQFGSDGSVTYPGGAFIDEVVLRVERQPCPPATAVVNTIQPDRPCYAPGATMGVYVDVGSTRPGQRVVVEVALATFDVLWATATITDTVPIQRVIPLTVPALQSTGEYELVATVWDADSGCYQGTGETTVRIDPACGTATPPGPTPSAPTPTPTRPGPSPTPLVPPCPNAGAVEVLFVMDTSGSMDDEFDALCGQISTIVAQLQRMGVPTQYRILGINEPRACATETVTGLVPGGVVNHQEDWAPAVVDLAGGFAWRPDHVRLIIPMSDEGPEDGDPVNDPGDDREAINAAIAAARANNVIVSPVLGTGAGTEVSTLAEALAAGTGGRTFASSDPAADMAAGIAELIGAAACTPVIQDVDPPCDITPQTTITITGGNFLPGASVTIGGLPARDVVRHSETRITCRIDPSLAQGPHDVTVSNPPGNWSYTAAGAVTVGPCEGACDPARPPVSPACAGPNYLRDTGFELGGRGWFGRSQGISASVSSQDAQSGFFSARFHGDFGAYGDAWIGQALQVPLDATAASFWVGQPLFLPARASGAKAPSGYDRFRASLYDATLSRELVTLWDVDPTDVLDCPIDDSSYNLSPQELDQVRGRQVVLVLRLHKASIADYALTVVLDDLHLTVCAPGPPCTVEGDKVASPGTVYGGEEVTVSIDVTGIEGACLAQRQPADVILVLDRSGSMSGAKIQAARTAAKGFVDRLDLSADQVALVSFGDSAVLDQGLTRSAAALRAAVDRQTANGNTDIIGGLETARAELAGPRRVPSNQAIVILLSDGVPTTGDPTAAASALKADGARIFTIGLGADVDPDLMRRLASDPADYAFAPDAADLDAIYERIAGAIDGSPATDMVIVDRLSSYVTLVPGSFTGSPAPSVSPDGKTLTWRIPRLGFETRLLTYRVRMTRSPGTWPTNDSAQVSYTDSNGDPASFPLPVPVVTVLPRPAPQQQPTPIPELVCRDHLGDRGAVPSNTAGQSWWNSPDIWVRNQPDGVPAPQDPVLGQTNYVYVRVHNTGSADVLDIDVTVYSAEGPANILWPQDWTPALGSATIPRLAAGASTVVSIPWVPTQEGHTCFLARIDAPADPVRIEGWVPFENNLCQRNVQIVDPGSGTAGGTGVGVGNRNRGWGYTSLQFVSRRFPVNGRATVRFRDAGLFERWREAGGEIEGGVLLPGEPAVELEVFPDGAAGMGALRATLHRIPFQGEERSAVELDVTVPPGEEMPEVEIVQSQNGRTTGGNVVRGRVQRPYAIFLPISAREGTIGQLSGAPDDVDADADADGDAPVPSGIWDPRGTLLAPR